MTTSRDLARSPSTTALARPATPNLTRRVLDLSLGVSSMVASALGGVVGVAIALATSGAVPWYWGAIGTLYAATVVKLVDTDRQRRELLAAQIPKLRIVFGGNQKPYLQEVSVWHDVGGKQEVFRERRFRVGIRNDSDQPITGARVVLERSDPAEGDMLFPGHALGVMGSDSRDGFFTAHPLDGPTAFVDVIHDLSPSAGPHSDWMYICYADQDLPGMLPPTSIRFTLRVDGGGVSDRKTFIIEKALDSGRLLVMKEAE